LKANMHDAPNASGFQIDDVRVGGTFANVVPTQ
jgi:hypothetical protein